MVFSSKLYHAIILKSNTTLHHRELCLCCNCHAFSSTNQHFVIHILSEWTSHNQTLCTAWYIRISETSLYILSNLTLNAIELRSGITNRIELRFIYFISLHFLSRSVQWNHACVDLCCSNVHQFLFDLRDNLHSDRSSEIFASCWILRFSWAAAFM